MFSGPAPDVELEQLIEIYKELDPLFREYLMLQIKQLLDVQKRGKKVENKEQLFSLLLSPHRRALRMPFQSFGAGERFSGVTRFFKAFTWGAAQCCYGF